MVILLATRAPPACSYPRPSVLSASRASAALRWGGGPRWSDAADASAERGERFGGLADDLLGIDGRELAAALQDAAVHDHRVDVAGLRRPHDRRRRIAHRGDVQVGRADEDEI